MKSLKQFGVSVMIACLMACGAQNKVDVPGFVKVDHGHFVRDGKPYY
jgi:hypothetical protein